MSGSDSAIATPLDILDFDSLSFESPPPDTRQRLLRFPLSDRESGLLLLADIVEVLQLPLADILPVPGVPETMLGVCNWRGEMLWLLDFCAFVGYSSLLQQVGKRSPVTVLVIQTQAKSIALGISRFEDIELHDLNHLQFVAPGLFPASLMPFLAGVLPGEQGVVLDAAAIVQCPFGQRSQEEAR